jgi:hypothetical protein
MARKKVSKTAVNVSYTEADDVNYAWIHCSSPHCLGPPGEDRWLSVFSTSSPTQCSIPASTFRANKKFHLGRRAGGLAGQSILSPRRGSALTSCLLVLQAGLGSKQVYGHFILTLGSHCVTMQSQVTVHYKLKIIRLNMEQICIPPKKNKQTPRSESASELYRPSDRRLSAKWLPTCADRRCQVVSVTDPYGRISRFSRQEPLLFYQVAPQFVLTRLSAPRSSPTTFLFSGSAGNRTRASGSVAKNSDH